MASVDNPLGLPLNNNGRAPALRVMVLKGGECDPRITQCVNFCRFLGSHDRYVQAFNRLPHHQQIIAVLIQEEWEDKPNLKKDHYI